MIAQLRSPLLLVAPVALLCTWVAPRVAQAVDPPTQVTAKGGTSRATLTWSACAGCTKYKVKRSTTNGGPYGTVSSNVTTTKVVDNTASNAVTYYYVVTGLNALNVESVSSAQVNATPLAIPTGFAAQPGTTSVALSWNATPAATGYRVRRSSSASGPWVEIGSTAGLSYTDPGLTPGTTYYYVVAATRGSNNESTQTAHVGAKPLLAPAAPTGVVATPGVGLVSLRWNPAADAASMIAERSDDGVSGWVSTPCAMQTATKCHATGLATGHQYFFRMRAVNENGLKSAPSAVVGAAIPMADWHAGTTASVRLMHGSAQCRRSNDFADYDDERAYDMDFATRMVRIASIVREEDPDVVVIDQVSAKDEHENPCMTTLVDELREGLPNFLYIGETLVMSRFPFAKFDASVSDYPVAQLHNEGDFVDDTDPFVSSSAYHTSIDSFLGYDTAESFPFGMVRVAPPGGGPINVAFADLVSLDHLNDSRVAYDEECYEWEHQQARRENLAAIQELIEATLSADQREDEPVFLLGILDIDGNRAPEHDRVAYDLDLETLGDFHSATPGAACSDPDNTDEYGYGADALVNEDFAGEWERVFANTIEPEAIFFGQGTNCFSGTCDASSEAFFTDAWGFEHPSVGDVADWGQNCLTAVNNEYDVATDFYAGQTSAEGWHPLTIQSGHRMDYILHNQPLDPDLGPFLGAAHLRRVFFFDPNGDDQFYKPETYESWGGYTDGIDGTTYAFSDRQNVSEHYFLVGDFLFARRPRSNPIPNDGSGPTFGSEIVEFGAQQDVKFNDLELTDPRHYQWFFLPDVGGTVTIGSNVTEEVEVKVYHPSDLSTPLPKYHDMFNCWDPDGICGDVYDLPDPPYFVRYSLIDGVEAPVEGIAGFHLHKCSDPLVDYCVLPNGLERTVTWPEGEANTPYSGATPKYDNAMYFVAAVDMTVKDPPVSFFLETEDRDQFRLDSDAPGEGAQLFDYSCGFDVEEADCDTSPCNVPLKDVGSWSEWTDDGDGIDDATRETHNEDSGILSPATPGSPKTVLLRVRRECVLDECLETRTTVRFDSSLRRVVPHELRVVIENDFGMNDDEVYMNVALDVSDAPGESSCESAPPPGIRLAYMDPTSSSDDDQTAAIETTAFGKYESDASETTFHDGAYVTFCESDGDSPNDFIGEVGVDRDDPPGEVQVVTMIEGDADDPISEYVFAYSVAAETLQSSVQQCGN